MENITQKKDLSAVVYLALMIAYMKALRIMAVKPAKSLEEDSNPLGTPLVGTTA